MPHTKIYLSNLNKAATDTQIKEHFSEYGEITEINLPVDRKTRDPKGYAFITFTEESSAQAALSQDGKSFLDQIITVQIATEKRKKK